MIAAVPALFCTLSSDCGFRSDERSDKGEAIFPIVESLKIPAVSMIGESINVDQHTLSPSNTSS